jgi:hypothetical protein
VLYRIDEYLLRELPATSLRLNSSDLKFSPSDKLKNRFTLPLVPKMSVLLSFYSHALTAANGNSFPLQTKFLNYIKIGQKIVEQANSANQLFLLLDLFSRIRNAGCPSCLTGYRQGQKYILPALSFSL